MNKMGVNVKAITVFRKKSTLQQIKDRIYYSYYYSIGSKLKKFFTIAKMFINQEKELYFLYEKLQVVELTYKNFYEHMSVDLGEFALLKFTDKNGNKKVYKAEYFGYNKKRNHGKRLEDLVRLEH